ncbi:MAG: UDP-N-acetylmuramate:L-alanyl-gamma-D-glutamyl-meso-diaminopimelate ligase [bacterium]
MQSKEQPEKIHRHCLEFMQLLNTHSLKNIYFIAICGTGMTALAGMLKSRGYAVQGADQNVYPPMSDFLQELGIPVLQGFSEKHLEPAPDLVIIGNSMSRGNPEVEAVLDNKIPYMSLPQALQEFFIRGQYSCVVAGTHGKTTTSSMLTWVLESSGRDPGFFIGGIPENFGRGFKIGNGGLFVSEGDEYDSAFFDKGSKFLHYMPDLVILNNIEFDHADIFKDIDAIETAFSRLLNLVPANGYLVANWDDPLVKKLSGHVFSKVVTFGLTAGDWRAENIKPGESFTELDVLHKGDLWGTLSIPLHGNHMVQNCLAVVAASTVLGLSRGEIIDGLGTFKNVRRRLQLVGEARDIKIFDDFAHHPTEVTATIDGLKSRYCTRRLWAVWEPRTATSKRNIYQQRYIESFDNADCVIMAPLHLPEKIPAQERLSLEQVSLALSQKGKPNWIVPAGSEMIDFLKNNLHSGDVVLFMSNGDFNQTPRKLLKVI